MARRARGRETPNPCVGCNGHVRLDAMLEFADALGAGALATGHYARRTADGLLRSAADPAKDQAYMLCALAPASVTRLRFPLGELTKPEVRALAAEAGLPVASQGRLAGPLLPGRHRARGVPGPPRRRARAAGRHRRPPRPRAGAPPRPPRFTVGQRKGIGVAAAEPLYVLATDARTNRVTVGARTELATRSVAVRGARLHRRPEAVDSVRLRYRSTPLPCRVEEQGRGRLTLHLGEPADAAAPGQTACLYAGDVVVGYGTIV